MESTPGITQSSDDKKAGLDPKEFQKRLIACTAIVLTLGILGGTCLGTKIKKAEKAQATSNEPGAAPTTPDERAKAKDE